MHNITKGSLYAISAFFCMAIFGILTKIASIDGNPIWVSFITYSTATLGTTLLILPKGHSAFFSTHYSLLITRAIIGTMASFLYMISMHYIPIVNATLLFNTAPIFIPLISLCLLKTSVRKSTWLAVFIGFIGILVIIKPNENIFTDPGNLIGLASGVALAIAYLCMKYLTNTETGLRIIFYYFSVGTLMQLPLLFFMRDFPSTQTLFYSSCCGVFLMLAQLGLIKAYRYASASQVGVYQYSSVVFVALIEWLIWAKIPGFLDLIGFILVSIAGIVIIRSKL